MNFEIVKMSDEHVKEVSLIENLSFPDPWSETAFKEEINNETAVFLTAVCDGFVCGYIGFHFALDEGYIALVATHPEYRQKGIAKALIEKSVEKAKELKLSFLSLEVRVSNIPAQKLYHSCGFELVGKRPNFYQTPKEDAYIMTKYL